MYKGRIVSGFGSWHGCEFCHDVRVCVTYSGEPEVVLEKLGAGAHDSVAIPVNYILEAN